MSRIILILLCFLPVIVSADKVEIGQNILRNGDFESELRYWQVKHPITWNKSGVDNSGAIFMNASFKKREKYIYEVTAQQCLEIGNAGLFYFEAKFRYDDLPQKKQGHRINLVWFEDQNCRQGGQFGTYIEPEISHDWQRLSKENILPAINSRSVMVSIVQNQSTSAKQLSWLERVWKFIVELFGFEFIPKLASATWDDLALIPTKMIEPTTSVTQIDNSQMLPVGQNYIQNGAFTDGKEHWRISANNEWSKHEGSDEPGSLRTTIQSSSGSMGRGVLSQCVNFGALRNFEMGIHFKHDTKSTQKGGARLRPTWYEHENCQGRAKISTKHADPSSISGWQELKVTDVNAPKGTRSVKIVMIQTIKGPGTYSAYWDDAYFIAISE